MFSPPLSWPQAERQQAGRERNHTSKEPNATQWRPLTPIITIDAASGCAHRYVSMTTMRSSEARSFLTAMAPVGNACRARAATATPWS